MTVTKRRHPKEKIARRGNEIYERDIKPRLKPRDKGKFVAIDIDSGEYEIDASELAACDRLYARLPNAQPWLVRIGSRTAYRFGAILIGD